ncbi:MAG: hypothetical protein MMC23_006179 [Stictis urceolatum]|nr:hypothetical protein [Stictis urceolata]
MTQAGLNTVNLSKINTFQQALLLILILVGSTVLVSSMVVHTRKRAFERRFAGVLEEQIKQEKALRPNSKPFSRALSRKRTGASGLEQLPIDGVVVRGRAIRSPVGELSPDGSMRNPENPDDRPPAERLNLVTTAASEEAIHEQAIDSHDPHELYLANGVSEIEPISNTGQHIRFVQNSTTPLTSPKPHKRVLSMSGVGVRPELENHPRLARTPSRPISAESHSREGRGQDRPSTARYFESDGVIDRNSQFHSLSSAERERLGGVEYRAVTLLETIILSYYVLWQLIGCLGLGAWIAHNQRETTLRTYTLFPFETN